MNIYLLSLRSDHVSVTDFSHVGVTEPSHSLFDPVLVGLDTHKEYTLSSVFKAGRLGGQGKLDDTVVKLAPPGSALPRMFGLPAEPQSHSATVCGRLPALLSWPSHPLP